MFDASELKQLMEKGSDLTLISGERNTESRGQAKGGSKCKITFVIYYSREEGFNVQGLMQIRWTCNVSRRSIFKYLFKNIILETSQNISKFP